MLAAVAALMCWQRTFSISSRLIFFFCGRGVEVCLMMRSHAHACRHNPRHHPHRARTFFFLRFFSLGVGGGGGAGRKKAENMQRYRPLAMSSRVRAG